MFNPLPSIGGDVGPTPKGGRLGVDPWWVLLEPTDRRGLGRAPPPMVNGLSMGELRRRRTIWSPPENRTMKM